jgi:hypothetical protein
LLVCIRGGDEVHNQTCDFDLHSDTRPLVPLIGPLSTNSHEIFFLAKFRGRQELTYKVRNKTNGIFIYEIDGTSEVHERLLLPGDALSIKGTDIIELEALTHEAIVLIMEIPLLS